MSKTREIKEHQDIDGNLKWIIYENEQSIGIYLTREEAIEAFHKLPPLNWTTIINSNSII